MDIYSIFHTPEGKIVVTYTATQVELKAIKEGTLASKPGEFFASAERNRDNQLAKVMTRTQASVPVDLS